VTPTLIARVIAALGAPRVAPSAELLADIAAERCSDDAHWEWDACGGAITLIVEWDGTALIALVHAQIGGRVVTIDDAWLDGDAEDTVDGALELVARWERADQPFAVTAPPAPVTLGDVNAIIDGPRPGVPVRRMHGLRREDGRVWDATADGGGAWVHSDVFILRDRARRGAK
jgi:hypothetical protein